MQKIEQCSANLYMDYTYINAGAKECLQPKISPSHVQCHRIDITVKMIISIILFPLRYAHAAVIPEQVQIRGGTVQISTYQ